MQIKNPKVAVPYWDEGNWNLYPWYKKGKWKKLLRKRWLRKNLKEQDESPRS